MGLGNKLKGLCTALTCCALLSGVAFADGDDTLGAPSITIADGTGIVAAGVGMSETSTGTLEVEVPSGVTIKQVLLYWGGDYTDGGASPDADITVEGNDITGDAIGEVKMGKNNWVSTAFRKDITGLGLVSTGTNSIDVSNLSFPVRNFGIGVIVIIDDGGSDTIELRDGVDYAFIDLATEALRTTDKQTFNVASSSSARTAQLSLFVGSVVGDASGGGVVRPNTIEVSSGGTTTTYINNLDSNDGEEHDTFIVDVNIPANATTVSVQLFSDDRNGVGTSPASMSWITAGLSVPPAFTPDPCIEIRKNKKDVNNVPDSTSVDSGSDVDIEIEVKNCGNVDLTEVAVDDDTHDQCDYEYKDVNGNWITLKPGQTFKYTCTVKNVTADVTNEACVEGTYKPDPNDSSKDEIVDDCDKFKICINPDPDIDIRKDNEGPDCTLIDTGGSKTFKIVVTNTGNVDLTKVEVTDVLSPECDYEYKDTNGNWITLEPGKSFDYECTVDDITEGFNNEACVEGTYDPDPNDPNDDEIVKDCDPSEVKIREQCCGIKDAPKPTGLSFIYTGLNCDDDDADNNTQDSDKWDCEDSNGGPDGATTVTICVTDKENRDLFSDDVNLGEVFSFSALKADGDTVKFESEAYFTIKDSNGNTLQKVTIHTSCSQDLIVGDTFGALEFWGCVSKPPEDNDKCCGDGVKVKPTQLTFTYTGDDCSATDNTQKDDSCEDKNGGPNKTDDVVICVTDKNDNDMFSETVSVGDDITITGTKTDKDGRPKFEGNTYIVVKTTTGTVLQEITIHTSCSQDLIVDDQFGSLKFKDCSTTTPGGEKEKCCGKGTKIKPTALTFTYTGLNCDDDGADNNTQDSKKWSCEDQNGGPDGADEVTICVTDKEDRDLFSGTVALNDSFEIKAKKKDKKKDTVKFEADMFVTIKNADGDILQKIKIHSSCSQDLAIGDTFGALEFEECSTTPPGGTNNGNAICIKGKKGKAVSLTFQYTGGACTDSDNSQAADKTDCEDFGDGPNGQNGVTITITDKNGNELYEGNVDVDGTFTIEGAKDDGKFESETYYVIKKDGSKVQEGEFHTSCSQPLRIDDVYGALKLIEGEDEDGNKFD